MSTSKEIAMALTLFLGLGAAGLRAQTFTAPLQASTTGTNPVDFEFRADGTLIAKGNLGVGTLQSGDQGAGTRLLWYPARGAFRAGMLSIANIGQGSAAFGENTMASGASSFAAGQYSTASGGNSVALGSGEMASGYGAVALGDGTSAIGNWALALGLNSNAIGGESIAAGTHAWATGYQATAIGYATSATGMGAAALNSYNAASGDYAAAFGSGTTASSHSSFAVGRNNVGGGSLNSWVTTDPLFEVGNGASYSSKADAFVVYKNGSAKFSGVVQVQPGGDIPMYTGN